MTNIAMIADNLDLNGISTVIVNYANALSEENYNIFVFAGEKVDNSFRNKDRYHFKIIELPQRKKNTLSYYRLLYKGLKKNKIDIAHIHGNSAMITPELIVCKMAGIKNRVVHCHNTTCDHKYMNMLLLPVMNAICTQRFACSDMAGKWLFKKKEYTVIPNGFVTTDYAYSEEQRIATRKELYSDTAFLVGHVGKFNEQKNHEFIIRVFSKILEKRSNAKLLLIGTGPKYSEIYELVCNLKLEKSVIFLGETDRPEKYYSAMDAFLFPSLYEGLGIVAIEAQLSGVPCYVSDFVPKEVSIGDNIYFLPLSLGIEAWAEKILNTNVCDRSTFFEQNKDCIDRYNINKCLQVLTNKYREMES